MIFGSEIMCVIKYTTPELYRLEVWLMVDVQKYKSPL